MFKRAWLKFVIDLCKMKLSFNKHFIFYNSGNTASPFLTSNYKAQVTNFIKKTMF